ncbi:MAG: hypothetical protein ABL866_01205 [Devosia sp.]
MSIVARLMPGWRLAFLMLLTFFLVLAASWSVLLAGKWRENRELVSTWLGLFDRCRVSIETRQPLEISGLVAISPEPDPLASNRDEHLEYWHPATGGRFMIRESGTLESDSLRICEVTLENWRKPLSRNEIAQLAYAFLEVRGRLTALLTHEPRDLIPSVPGIVSVGFGPVEPNAVGCPVISLIMENAEASTFSVMTGEQGAHCRGRPPLLVPGSLGPAPLSS